jgi:hypothetical protein
MAAVKPDRDVGACTPARSGIVARDVCCSLDAEERFKTTRTRPRPARGEAWLRPRLLGGQTHNSGRWLSSSIPGGYGAPNISESRSQAVAACPSNDPPKSASLTFPSWGNPPDPSVQVSADQVAVVAVSGRPQRVSGVADVGVLDVVRGCVLDDLADDLGDRKAAAGAAADARRGRPGDVRRRKASSIAEIYVPACSQSTWRRDADSRPATVCARSTSRVAWLENKA